MKKKILISLIILVALVAVSVGGVLGYLKLKPAKSNLNDQILINQPINSSIIDNNVNGSTAEKPFAPAEVDNTTGEIVVDWYDQPVEISVGELFGDNLEPLIKNIEKSKGFIQNYDSHKTGWEVVSDIIPKIVGRVKSGPYQGSNFYLIKINSDFLGDNLLLRAIGDYKNGRIISLSRYSNYLNYYNIFTENSVISIANLEPPSVINIPNSTIKFIKSEKDIFKLFPGDKFVKPLFKYNGQDYLYRDTEDGCFFVKVADGTIRDYYFDLDFFTSQEKDGPPSRILDITWNDGNKNSNEYSLRQLGSCGIRCYNYHNKYDISIDQLKKAGYLSGYPIYEPKNKDVIKVEVYQKDKMDKVGLLEKFYEEYYPGYQKEKVSLDAFIADHPAVYWQDPFGDFMEFQSVKYAPLAECAKPVIYLYPQEKMDISVKVFPNGGFSLTEPSYNNGWLVSANPNGQLYNYTDRKTYPYLFWEGYGLGYRQPQEGFVVAKAEIGGFLIDKLQQLGLVKNEYQEFIDFWLPKMQSANYYFITFVPQAEFDKLAPLQVLPRPDTIIRVFMDYEPLTNYQEVPPQKIVTPERKGFTVVEWGGAAHKR